MEGETKVRWNAWEPALFERAREEGKLVFLDISATWCHWCHVLDRTSLSDPRVVALLNDSYLPVRVDTDRRPDINERYNRGGWPTTAILLPDGRPLTGATYLPPDALFEVLAECADLYRSDPRGIERSLDAFADRAAGPAEQETGVPPGGPRPEDLSLVGHAVLAQYDPVFPGFFREPKFPVAEILSFLRDAWVLEGNREMGETLLKILRTMGGSGVFDSVGGGFFRYATRRNWTVPHYEKLLGDNAEMLALYASAYGKTGDSSLSVVAGGILGFLFGTLYDPGTGAFFSSQDADEAYYGLPPGERSLRSAPGVDRTVISEYNARAVSALAAAHAGFATRPTATDGLVPREAGCRERPTATDGLVPREAGCRERPTATDGLVPREAGCRERPSGVRDAGALLDRAERLGRFLRESLWNPEDGQLRFREGDGAEAGHLADNVAALTAHLDLWDATGNRDYLGFAGQALDWTVRRLYSAKAPGFLDRRPRAGDAAKLGVPVVPFAANARAACALIRYGREAARPDLLGVAEQVLKRLSSEFDKRAAFGAPYGSALLLYRHGSRGAACRPGDPTCP